MRTFVPVRAAYVRRLRGQVMAGPRPQHVGLIMDGNRRWARRAGLANVSLGHKYGAERAEEMLGWCTHVGVRNVTVYLCSTENLARRDRAEVDFLMNVIETGLARRLATHNDRWRVHTAGMLDALPDSTGRALKEAVEATSSYDTGFNVTLAVGYGGQREIVDAARSVMYERAAAGDTPRELADSLRVEDIERHLYTAGRPDPDLIIRTSGEQRLSNFLSWQGAYAQLYVCEAPWPAFREIDFLRALRDFAGRHRRAV
ncbi:polyprenyl diphosphate synthase [Solicola gregarius]|uniref:Isoprenyl transferase n=1 Tax=Solicola gregarius TaxID=2908642 RepID=A0AA46TH28_9ACTN|nr:polyprenyl diphosphate synthase [Solicola gregarius]UYM05058.1 polyprenyl diphosphate synthase [Solicola gregarius]